MEDIIVYTCITNGKDTLKNYTDEEGIRYICFNDGTVDITGNWEDYPILDHYKFEDPRRTARYHKINPSIVLPEHTWSVWIDGSLIPKVRIDSLINFLKNKPNGEYGVRPHPGWNCIYNEAGAIIHYGFEDKDIINTVVNKYKSEGFPENFGLHETGVLVRKNTPENMAFDNLWWEQVSQYSKRDQMSFDYVRWKTGKKFFELTREWFGQDPDMPFFGHKHGE
jgi:hypothetical protein